MNKRKLLMPLLFCKAVINLYALPNQPNKLLMPEHASAHFLLPHYDTSAHKVIWSLNNQYALNDMHDHLPDQFSQQTSAITGANYHLVKDINTATDSYPGNFNFTQTNPQFAVLNNRSEERRVG